MGNPCKIPGILSVRIGFSLFYWAIRWLGVRKIVRGKPIRKMTDFFLPAFYYLNAWNRLKWHMSRKKQLSEILSFPVVKLIKYFN